MRNFISVSRYVLVLFFFLSPLPVAAEAGPPVAAVPSTETALADFDAFVAETLRKWNVPGVAIAVVKDGTVVHSKGYGTRDVPSGAAMTKDTIFPIASMTKAFTSFGVGLLVDEGKMSFDAPVTAYLPGLTLKDPAASQGLTLRDMLSHRSGMPRHDAIWYHNSNLTLDGSVARMAYLEPSAPLRAKWQYNNAMFVLSGLAIGKVSGQSWDDFTRDRIFKPLDMNRTTLSAVQADAAADHITGTEIRVGKHINVPLFHTYPLMSPAGGIYSTADDIGKWMSVHLSNGVYKGRQVIQPATLAELHRTQMATGTTPDHPDVVPTGYGLGWFTDIYRGRQMVSHGGNLNGISTLVTLIPERKLGVTVLVNQGASELPSAMTRAILDRFLGLQPIDWTGEALMRTVAGEKQDIAGRGNKEGTRVAGTRPSRVLADYAGAYSHPGYGALSVTNGANGLVGKYNDDSSPLGHFHYDVFDAATNDPENLWVDGRVQFVSDFAGRISAVQVVMEPQVAPIVFTKQPDLKLSDPAYLRALTGTYDSGGTNVVIALSGNRLIYTAEGGSPADLIPSLGGEFVHSRALDSRIAFKTDASKRVSAMTMTNSAGVFEAKRID